MPQQRLSAPEPETPPARPVLADDLPRFLLLEREVEIEYRPQMLAALQSKVDAVAAAAPGTAPWCPRCGQPMRPKTRGRSPGWLAAVACTLPYRVTVARLAATSAGLCWICWG